MKLVDTPGRHSGPRVRRERLRARRARHRVPAQARRRASPISPRWPATCTSPSIISSGCSRAGRASAPSASCSTSPSSTPRPAWPPRRACSTSPARSACPGPGRLHDLFVTLEAMSPGEYKAGGAGLAIRYGVHDSPFGPALIAATARGICGLHFLDGDGDGSERCSGRTGRRPSCARPRTAPRRWPSASSRRSPRGPAAPLALLVNGSNFQFKVWRALLELPSGVARHLPAILPRRIGAPGCRARRRQRDRRQSDRLADPLPPRHPRVGSVEQLPLGRRPARPPCSAGRPPAIRRDAR